MGDPIWSAQASIRSLLALVVAGRSTVPIKDKHGVLSGGSMGQTAPQIL
jgi:hypothetical protein